MNEPRRRGRPPKARLEGEQVPYVMGTHPATTIPVTFHDNPDPVPGNNGAALARIAAYFRAEHPDEWESMRLCPLESGLDAMAGLLK